MLGDKLDGLKYYYYENGILIEVTDYCAQKGEKAFAVPEGFINEDYNKKQYYSIDEEKNAIILNEKGIAAQGLNKTDYKIARHRDQIEMEVATTMTDDEYKELLQKRQAWRDTIS